MSAKQNDWRSPEMFSVKIQAKLSPKSMKQTRFGDTGAKPDAYSVN